MLNETCAPCITFGQGLNACIREEDVPEAVPQILSTRHARSSGEDSVCVTSTMDHVKCVRVYKMGLANTPLLSLSPPSVRTGETFRLCQKSSNSAVGSPLVKMPANC
jgi:hypothetical protein